MAKPTKATKKFQSKHLKHTIEHRKEVQKHNKKYGLRKKKSDEPEPEQPKKASKEVFDDMTVDDFFAGGFEVPKEKKKKGKKQESESEESDEAEDDEDMQQDMDDLAEKDPEFYNYLKKNDKALLDFEGSNPLDGIEVSDDEEEEEEEEAPVGAQKQPQAERTRIEITSALVKEWDTQLKTPSLDVLREVEMAFRAAVKGASADHFKYVATDPKAFSELMVVGLRKVPEAVQKLVPYTKSQHGVRTIPQGRDANQVAAVLKAQAGLYITLLKDVQSTETAAMVLASVQEVLPYYVLHRKLLKELLGAVAGVWALSAEIDTQVAAYAFLRNACGEFPKLMLENVLRKTYAAFLQRSRRTTVQTMPNLNFCKNSAAGLCEIDEASAYQVGFEHIRQLAIHLRGLLLGTARDPSKAVYNWQFCHALDFWSRVVAQHCVPEKELKHKLKELPLRPLVYPLVQVTLGAVRLVPTAQFFPLRFYLVRLMLRIMQTTGVYIPVFPLIAEVLTSSALSKGGKRTTLPPVDFDHSIKVSQQYLATKVYQDGLCEQVLELTGEFFAVYSKSVAFPELATPAVLAIRRYSKRSKNVRFNRQLNQLVEKLTANSTFITSKRSGIEYGPANKIEVLRFLQDLDWEKTPLGQYVVVQRQLVEQKKALLREAQLQEAASQKEKKDEDEDEDVDMADLDEEDEDEE